VKKPAVSTETAGFFRVGWAAGPEIKVSGARPTAAPRTGCRKSPRTFPTACKMPLLLRRGSAQKSSLRLPEALHSKTSGAF